MAYERTTDSIVLGDSLDTFVSGISTMFRNQMAERNAADELNFNTQVLSNNLSLQGQLDYREAQLDRVSGDTAETARIKGEIASLTDRIEQQKFSDGYTDQITAYAAGTESVDSVISWLQDTLSSASDINLQNKIKGELEAMTQKRFDLTQQMMKDQTDYAIKDKTASVLGTQIAKIQDAKSTALLAGDRGTAASLDLQLQALNQALSNNSIERDIKDMAVSTATGFSSAQNLLDSYNSKIRSSDTSRSVTVGGVTYNNAQEYWTYARDKYLSDQSSSGFFPRIDQETTTAMKVKNSNNTLTTGDIQSASSTYDTLRSRPELANFSAQIDAAKADTLQTAADYISQKIVNTFDNNLDLTTAVSSLNALKGLGVNVDAAYQKVLTSAAATQSTSLQNIIANAQILMQQTPGLSIGDAVAQAIAKGSGIILSPNDLTGKTPGQNATDLLGGINKGTIPADNRTTLNGQPGAPAPAPGAPGAPAASASTSYVIQQGDTLSALAHKFGTTVQALAQANGIADPNMIRAGATLNIPGAPAAGGTAPLATAPAGGSTGGPTSTTPLPTGATPAPAPKVDVTSTISQLRSQIQSGAITPSDAFHQLYNEIQRQSTNEFGTSVLGSTVESARSSLFAPLQINAGGKISNLNSDGSMTALSTTTNQSTTSINSGGTTSSTTYKTPTVQPVSQQQPTSTPASTPAPSAPSAPAPTSTSAPAPAPTPTAAPAPKPPVYSGVSIVDYLTSVGKASDYTTRSTLAKTAGIQNYTGTADQNTQLLKTLRGY